MKTFARLALFSAFTLQAVLIARADPAPTKSAKDCNEELALNKAAIEASGETPQAFFHRCWWESEPGKPTPIKTARASWDPGRSPKKTPHPHKVASEDKASEKPVVSSAHHATVTEPPARPAVAAVASKVPVRSRATVTAQAARAPEPSAPAVPSVSPAVTSQSAPTPAPEARHARATPTTPSLFGRKYIPPAPPQEDKTVGTTLDKPAEVRSSPMQPFEKKMIAAPVETSHPAKVEVPTPASPRRADKIVVRPDASPPAASPKVEVASPARPAKTAAAPKPAESQHVGSKSAESKPAASTKGEAPRTIVINKTAEKPKVEPDPVAKPSVAQEARKSDARTEVKKTEAKKTEVGKSERKKIEDARKAPDTIAMKKTGDAKIEQKPRSTIVAMPSATKPPVAKTEKRVVVAHEPARHHRLGHMSRPLPIAEAPVVRPMREQRVHRAALPAYVPHAASPRRTAMAHVPAEGRVPEGRMPIESRTPMGPSVCVYAQPDALGHSPCVPVPMP